MDICSQFAAVARLCEIEEPELELCMRRLVVSHAAAAVGMARLNAPPPVHGRSIYFSPRDLLLQDCVAKATHWWWIYLDEADPSYRMLADWNLQKYERRIRESMATSKRILAEREEDDTLVYLDIKLQEMKEDESNGD